ncbi:MAG TPA: di-heme oxidoredictase family protein, partial [Myxococcales bacterium]|nr:di-heme oxidoredictase family protein [Myxococcales bacterium]
SGDAYLNEMGVTNPIFPDESCPQGNCALLAGNPAPGLNDDGTGVERFNDFMTFLAPPPRGPRNFLTEYGNIVASVIGCLDCHAQTLQTGPHAVAALDHVTYHPFSDFLLHDMGSLGDGITQNRATGGLMRTQPLWGLRTQARMLHDGRATTIRQAILAHDGQGAASREAFQSLGFLDRSALIAFLQSL